MASGCYFKKALREILSVKGAKVTYRDKDCAYITLPYFFIRVFDDNQQITIQLAERKTFDRWANSINFKMTRSKCKQHYFPLFVPDYKWAKRVVKSGLFNFNTYIGRIELPWLESGRNK